MFIQTEATPNPATLKFLPGRIVNDAGSVDFRGAGEAEGQSPLATALFEVPGVTGVFFGYDFVTVTKDESSPDWPMLKPAILAVIMEHFMSGAPVMTGDATEKPVQHDDGEFFAEGDEQIVATIKELLDTRVRPAVAQDGGDITFKGFQDGTVFLSMRGACSSCPSSTATLKHGIQNLLRHFVPEVEQVEAV